MTRLIITGFCIALVHTLCYAQQPVNDTTNLYDFRPREKVIFEDNFRGDTIGNFPSKWIPLNNGLPNIRGNYSNNKQNIQVQKFGDDYAVQIISDSQVSGMEPYFKFQNYLPDSFTLEYDFLFGSSKAVFFQAFSTDNINADSKRGHIGQIFSLSHDDNGH